MLNHFILGEKLTLYFSKEEIMNMLGLDFQGSLMLIKAGQYQSIDVTSKK